MKWGLVGMIHLWCLQTKLETPHLIFKFFYVLGV